MAGRFQRARAAVQRRGITGTAREAATRAGQLVRLHEQHVWYDLDVSGVPATGPLDPPLELVLAAPADLHRVEELGRSSDDARAWGADGHDLWLVLDGDVIAFSCWNFRGRTPVLAAPGGWLELDDDTICLEHSITAPTHRGRGLAPHVWKLLANRLAGEGLRTMITKVEVENVPSRKAVLKAGFQEVAVQTLDRVGPHQRVGVEVMEQPTGGLLRDRLASTRAA